MKYVNLDENVTATFYDEEHEEWSRMTVSIKDVLDAVCDDYTVLSDVEEENDMKEIEEVRR